MPPTVVEACEAGVGVLADGNPVAHAGKVDVGGLYPVDVRKGIAGNQEAVVDEVLVCVDAVAEGEKVFQIADEEGILGGTNVRGNIDHRIVIAGASSHLYGEAHHTLLLQIDIPAVVGRIELSADSIGPETVKGPRNIQTVTPFPQHERLGEVGEFHVLALLVIHVVDGTLAVAIRFHEDIEKRNEGGGHNGILGVIQFEAVGDIYRIVEWIRVGVNIAQIGVFPQAGLLIFDVEIHHAIIGHVVGAEGCGTSIVPPICRNP